MPMVGSTYIVISCYKEKNMTNNKTLTLRSFDIPQIHKFGIGFDNMLDELMRVTSQQQTNYPPHNVRKIDEDHFVIDLAVAGFAEGEIDIHLEKNVLTITGGTLRDNEGEYLVHGISMRDFERTFTLAEYVEVTSAEMVNGILSIRLERIVPEEKKPKSIAINYNK
jgi:molecular chaperone IbpA